jgi:DNA-binding transcriptional LysR family regulator
MFDWDDLRVFLAVARAGSTLGASHGLGLDQTTVARRIGALEADLGTELFERRPDGYRLTGRGRELVGLAEPLASAAEAVAARADTWRTGVSGIVRVTTTETAAGLLLAPAMAALRTTHPGLKVELIVDDRRLDLARGDADVAVRIGPRPEGRGIVRRRLGESVWAVYCSRDYAARDGRPETVEAIDGHPVIGGAGPIAGVAPLVWLEKAAPHSEVVYRSNSVPNLIAAVKSGLGVSALPCLVGVGSPDLVALLPPLRDLSGDIWLVYRESLRRAPHVRAFAEAIAARVEAMRSALEGRGEPVR